MLYIKKWVLKLLFVISLSMVMTQKGVTSLYIASQNCHVTVVRLLLEKGTDVNICDKVVMDIVSCTCVWTFSQLAICYIIMYVCSLQRTVCRLTTQTLLRDGS